MAGDLAALFVENDLFVNVGAFLQPAIRLEKTTVKERLARGIQGFKLDPRFI